MDKKYVKKQLINGAKTAGTIAVSSIVALAISAAITGQGIRIGANRYGDKK